MLSRLAGSRSKASLQPVAAFSIVDTKFQLTYFAEGRGQTAS
jgi:hypothetical protein